MSRPEIGELGFDAVGHADAAGKGQPLQPRGDIHRVAEQIVALRKDAPGMDADPDRPAPRRPPARAAALDRHRRGDGRAR